MWLEDFNRFCADFETYLADFQATGWHEQHCARYRDNLPAVIAGDRGTTDNSAYLQLHAAIMLLLDGRRKLTTNQKAMRKSLLFRWKALHNSGLVTHKSTDGPSLWSGVRHQNK